MKADKSEYKLHKPLGKDLTPITFGKVFDKKAKLQEDLLLTALKEKTRLRPPYTKSKLKKHKITLVIGVKRWVVKRKGKRLAEITFDDDGCMYEYSLFEDVVPEETKEICITVNTITLEQ